MREGTVSDAGISGVVGAPMLTNRATAVLADAANVARRLRQETLGTEHLLLGLLAERTLAALLKDLGVDAHVLATRVEAALPPAPSRSAAVAAPAPSPELRQALQVAESEATRGGKAVGPEHLLLGLLSIRPGLAPKLLREAGISLKLARRALAGAEGD